MTYTVVSFAPVQGFIEKSRKLRDLIGASQILSYLAYSILEELEQRGYTIISPALIEFNPRETEQGLPNLIIVQGDTSVGDKESSANEILLEAWREILEVCRTHIEQKLDYRYHWNEAWQHWGNHAWEVFVGSGESRQAAIEDLENKKLPRAWTAINWTGESSSLSGQDAICYPNMGHAPFLCKSLATSLERRESQRLERANIKAFYDDLAMLTFTPKGGEEVSEENIGKFVSPKERLSLPELIKRLVTRDEIYRKLPGMPDLERGFRDMIRIPEDDEIVERQWTGWFMGDGDKVGDYLKTLQEDEDVKCFSKAMRTWGRRFSEEFPEDFGRVIYAGGDDFFGVIYNPDFEHNQTNISGEAILTWLGELKTKWQEHGYTIANGKTKDLNFSMGFIWAAPAVPQRDVLQHCREAEKLAKSKGRDRVTIRIVFNNGQYVQWTCPWELISILQTYKDRDGRKNWGHIYGDLAQLEARHAFCLGGGERQSFTNSQIRQAYQGLCQFMSLYFPEYKERFFDDELSRIKLFGEDKNAADRNWDGIYWSRDLIRVGWHLCR